MSLNAGIVGMPNVGKSTLFNAITNSQIEAANYPFATIEPNVGIVNVLDERIYVLEKMYASQKVIPAAFKFIDIAGLVKGASKGEGLGNQFLSNIREVDAICHVVRCFDDSDITHVEGSVNPVRDIDIINTELMISDLEVVTTRIQRVERKANSGDKESQYEFNILVKLRTALDNLKPIRAVELNSDELDFIKNFNFLTIKPVLYVANVSEKEINSYENNRHYIEVKKIAHSEKAEIIAISAKIESEIANLAEEDKKNVHGWIRNQKFRSCKIN